MDDDGTGTGKVDAVLRGVTFYSQSFSHARSHLKTVPDVRTKTATCTDARLRSPAVSVCRKSVQQSERRIGGSRPKVVERRAKSIESLRLTKSKYRLIRKPKCTLLPYKRGQLKLHTNAENVIVRNRTAGALNSEMAAEKENKVCYDNCSGNGVTEKLNVQGTSVRRFFKAGFGKRRQFTLDVRGLTTHHTKLNHLKQRERKTTVGSKQSCLNVGDVCSKHEIEQKTNENCENDLATASNVDTTDESLCMDAEHKNTELAVESSKVDVEKDSKEAASMTDCAMTDDCDMFSDVEPSSDVSDTSDTADHSTASLHMSTTKLYSDNAVTSPSLKHGLGLSSYVIRTNRRKCEDTSHKAMKKDKEQMQLDFGQKLHETVNCGVCGMTYIRCEPVDELTHSQYHRKVFATLKFTVWRKTAVVHEFDDGSCIIAVSCDDKRNSRRVAEIKKLVDRELGYIVEGSLATHSKTYLYISSKHVVGFCLAQHITHGYRLLPADDCVAEDNRNKTRSCCCSEEPVPARCGISRIWVLASERRKHVATQLLDVVRGDFLMGCPVAKEELAFSDPTPDGIKFATRYTGSSAFLVYKTAA